MEKEKKERKNHPLLLRYLISFAVAALMALGVMSIRGLFSGEEMSLYDTYKAFDALRFVGHSLIGLLKKRRPGEKSETYADYKEKLAKKGKGKFFYMIIVGAVFVAVAAVFLLLSESLL